MLRQVSTSVLFLCCAIEKLSISDDVWFFAALELEIPSFAVFDWVKRVFGTAFLGEAPFLLVCDWFVRKNSSSSKSDWLGSSFPFLSVVFQRSEIIKQVMKRGHELS